MKTPSLKFYLKPISHDRYSHTVMLRLVYDRKKAEISTKMRCKENQWDPAKERFKNNFIFNQRLSKLETKVYEALQDLETLGKDFTVKDIKSALGEGRKPRVTLSEFYQEYLQRQVEEGMVKRVTVKKYRQTFDYINRYKEQTGQDLSVKDIDLGFITTFDEWLKKTPYNENGDKLKLTSVNKHHSRLKAVLNNAIKRGLLILNPYTRFKLSFPSSNREYLSHEEIEVLKNVDLSNFDTANQVRDIFLFSCYTGLRFSDASALKMEQIVKINETMFLRLEQIKTGERREIPLLDQALIIIEKYSWCNARLVNNFVLPRLSNQRVNQYLKFIAEKAGIKKHLTHHIARHTCATTILLDHGVSLETVSHWLGHNSVRTTQIYAKISHRNLNNELERLNRIVG